MACALHLVAAAMPAGWTPWTIGALICAAGFLPALGASLAGISTQGEFRRIAKRSGSMAARLKELERRAQSLASELTQGGGTGAAAEATAIAVQAAQLMIDETLDWRVVRLDHPLNPA